MINWSAICYAPVALLARRRLLRPVAVVSSLAAIDPAQLSASGCTGMVLDFDDTLTEPGAGQLSAAGLAFTQRCAQVWGKRVAILSDSAGTPRDERGLQATAIETVTGVPVLRHRFNKPNGFSVVRDFFGDTTGLAVVGDQVLTDVVFGNRNGLRTILVRRS
jgi:phosphatidylglycerophosphatase GEP4